MAKHAFGIAVVWAAGQQAGRVKNNSLETFTFIQSTAVCLLAIAQRWNENLIFFFLTNRLVLSEYVLQKELEKEVRKVADRQTELSAEIQSMRKDMGSEFDKHNSSQNAFRKQLQVKNNNNNNKPLYTHQMDIFNKTIIIIFTLKETTTKYFL